MRAAALLVRVGPGVGEAVPAAMGATRAATAQPVASASGRGLCSSGVAWEPQARGFASAAEPAATADKLGLVVSEAAVARLKELGPGVVLRVMVEGGGCSGFQYEFSLDEAPREDDRCVGRCTAGWAGGRWWQPACVVAAAGRLWISLQAACPCAGRILPGK